VIKSNNPFTDRKLSLIQNRISLAILALLIAGCAGVLPGCVSHMGPPGTVDRTFRVSGPVRLEVTNGSGDTRISGGQPGEVHIHAEFRVKSWSEHGAKERTVRLEANPPFSQDGNVIRVGGSGLHTPGLVIHYTISTPLDTQVYAAAGSGDIDVSGLAGPVIASTGSGNISVANIAGGVQATSGSGTIQLASTQGQVQATSGAGNMSLASTHGEVRLQTGSGAIQISAPAGDIVVSSGSGNVTVAGATSDLRLRTGSGSIQVAGDPEPSTYWDFRASSGNISLHVSPKASLRFYARTNSGDIDAAIPVVMEGTAGKHALRARIGDGKARVEVETSSGNVSLH